MSVGILADVNAPSLSGLLQEVRTNLGDALFARVAGPDGPRRRERVHDSQGPRWFPEGSPIHRVHGDASMFVGGLRALLMQSLHPLAMAGVADHSGFQGDPWGRLQRTSYFLAVTTFGTAADAERMVAAVRAVHDKVVGTAPDGRRVAALVSGGYAELALAPAAGLVPLHASGRRGRLGAWLPISGCSGRTR